MTTAQHATVRAIPRWNLFRALRRWTSAPTNPSTSARRARRSRRRTPFAPLSAAALAVGEMDQSELAADLEASRW